LTFSGAAFKQRGPALCLKCRCGVEWGVIRGSITMARRPKKGVPIMQVAQTLAACTPVFFAMGDDMRQAIIMALAETEELNVGQLASIVPLSRPAISHHLKILLQAKLVSVRRQGTENFYALEIDDALVLLKRFAFEVENCESWFARCLCCNTLYFNGPRV
jgi:ArsR family transcriptional regulator, arsenate/arsenite/antimonite-responsive transcriptional repressor